MKKVRFLVFLGDDIMLAKRLAACASLVTQGGMVCDVGTDHAYLAAFLLQKNICTRVIATDIHKGPLEAARRTLTEAGVLERAELLLCDGLQAVQPEGITDVVIAGMGGETIIHILENCPWKKQVKLILQPMTRAPLLRQWLAENNFGGWQEIVVKEGERFYQIFLAVYTGTTAVLSDLEREVGFLPVGNPEIQSYAKRKLERFRIVAQQLSAGENPEFQKWKKLADALEEKLEEITNADSE